MIKDGGFLLFLQQKLFYLLPDMNPKKLLYTWACWP